MKPFGLGVLSSSMENKAILISSSVKSISKIGNKASEILDE